jgi:hypothetical protein
MVRSSGCRTPAGSRMPTVRTQGHRRLRPRRSSPAAVDPIQRHVLMPRRIAPACWRARLVVQTVCAFAHRDIRGSPPFSRGRMAAAELLFRGRAGSEPEKDARRTGSTLGM